MNRTGSMRTFSLSCAALLFACAHAKTAPAQTRAIATGSAGDAMGASGTAAASPELAGESVLDTRPVVTPLPPFDAPVPQEVSLPNGLRVLIMQRKEAPIEAVELVQARGGSQDPGQLSGVASLTAAMLEAGSAGKSQAQIAMAADALGASLHAGASEDATVISISGLTTRAPEMIALLADVALRPNFDPAEWKRVKSERLAGLLEQKAEPGAAAKLAFSAAVYGQNPLARPVSGTAASVANAQLVDVEKFFSHFSPNEAAIAVSGSLTAEELVPLLTAAFGKWRPAAQIHLARPGVQNVTQAQPVPPPPPASERPRLVLVNFPGKPQSVIEVGLPSVPRSSPDVMALRLLDAVLGGSFTSRLNQNLREQHGYTYGAGSQFAFGRGPGPFVAYASVKTDVTGAALKEMLGEISRAIDAPLTAPEIEKGKALLAFDLISTLDHADAAAAGAAGIFLYGLPLDEFRTFVPRLDALDAAKVQAAGKRAVDPAALTVVVAGDLAKVVPQLTAAKLQLGVLQLRDAEGQLIK